METLREGYLPKGKYLISDPCYIQYSKRDKADTDNSIWSDFCDALHKKERETNRNRVVFDFRGYEVFVSGTAYGDGSYCGNNGEIYGVDAGILGCVPVEVADPDFVQDVKEGELSYITYHEFDSEIECYYDEGKVVMGSVEIDTDPPDPNACPECGYIDCCDEDCEG